ncbi:MAG: hypothetical protein KDK70_22350 [Myxococcales bacterium]|nr:hypothetical protein [Myxococcales bacterium]
MNLSRASTNTDRQLAYNATGIRIPKPVMLQWPEDIAKFSATGVCTVDGYY